MKLLALILLTSLAGCISMQDVRQEIHKESATMFFDRMKSEGMLIDWIATVEKKSDKETLVKLWDEYVAQNYRMDTSYSLVGVMNNDSTFMMGQWLYAGKWKPRTDVEKRQNFNSFNGFIEYLRKQIKKGE